VQIFTAAQQRGLGPHHAHQLGERGGHPRQPLARFGQTVIELGRAAHLDLHGMDPALRRAVTIEHIAARIGPVLRGR
jgi:hypothetical protein